MNDNNEIMILDAVERYIRGEMNPDERLYFENLRKTNPAIDQLVVEHTLFLQQMNQFGERRNFKTALQEVHTGLSEQGKIHADKLNGKARVVYLWKRYRRVAAIAASIAGITTIALSSLVWSISPKPIKGDIEKLSRDLFVQQVKTDLLQNDLDKVKKKNSKADADKTIEYKTAATGFLIDGKGLMITNAHVVKNSRNIRVFNVKGQQFNAFVVKLDVLRDVAIIKIDDSKFKSVAALPYGIAKSSTDIAEPIFTLGFPRDEIVYGEGYMSARTGYKGDTLSCQIAVPANPGNSGGPVFNHKGEVIGILSARQTQAEEAVFAIQSKYIFNAVDEIKKNDEYRNVKVSTRSTLTGMNKVEQVKKIQDYVFMVKGD
ncbi:MAG: trypsin-like peptidase domain-containing protein [Chitinophagaceae bacterium]|nr:trypsin-like peptidase domain-containing protein [Chitinophagaceae bacterium]